MNLNINNLDCLKLITRIKEINWEFKDADTQYLTHNIHRYSGKFIPQIARTVIEIITEENDIVLDPYMGSGTTILEAMLLNRRGIGIDINPLAILISEVKTSIIEDTLLENMQNNMFMFVDSILDGQISLFDNKKDKKMYQEIENNPRYNDEWNKKWYQKHVLEQLIAIYTEIELIENEQCRKVAQVAFSDILRRFSNASSRYPNVMYDKNVKVKSLPGRAFKESLINVVNQVKGLSKINNINLNKKEIIYGNNTKLDLPDNYVDAIITHPPYIAAVPYAEYGCLNLNWLGYDSKKLDATLTGGKRQTKNVVERFEADYRAMLSESYRVLKKGKFIFLMVGNPTVKKEIIKLNDMTVRICEEIGFELIDITVREGQNRRGNKMGNEYLLFFQKP